MNPARILIAGIGNIFLGDDAFGVEVARRLAMRQLPADVRVVDFGIRSVDLTYALLDGHETVILVDATARGGAPGTLYVIEPETAGPAQPADLMVETHNMDPAKVLRVASSLGSPVKQILLVGCEPAVLGSFEELEMGLSAPVQAVVEEAVNLIEGLVAKILDREPVTI
jgi:hydrogenase maturation protease